MQTCIPAPTYTRDLSDNIHVIMANIHLNYLLGTFVYHDIGESSSIQPNGSNQTSNTSPDYDNVEVRYLSFQIVLRARSSR
jgi:hypothetical protein